MVNYTHTSLDRTFAALADPTRRALLAQLEAQDHQSISDLAQPFQMSLPAIMKHLDVLNDAGLITRTKTGRTVSCTLTAKPMEDAMAWLGRYERFWTAQFDRLAAFLENEQCSPPPLSPASPSRDVSKRRPRKSTKPGRTPKK